MQLKFYRYTVITYSIILLLSLALFYLFPKEGLLEMGSGGSGEARYETYHEQMEAWLSGELDRKDGAHPYKQWQFDFEGSLLKIISGNSGEEWFQPQLLIKRTAPGAGKITASEYRLFCSEYFPTGRLNPYSLDLSGERFRVQGPGRLELKFKAFNRDFTIEQFNEKKAAQHHQMHEWLAGRFEFIQGLYLYIPADVEIEYDPESVSVSFADEEGSIQ